uniref:Uncharacterized protein n=1 Tax=Rhizophora mucronata TaxID=61149 RepID=A0A2P2N653_RHIMU
MALNWVSRRTSSMIGTYLFDIMLANHLLCFVIAA